MTQLGAAVRTPATTDNARPTAGRRRRIFGEGTLVHPASHGMLLVLPAVVFVAVFILAPLVFAIYISLTNWPLIGSYKFIGLGNYASIGTDPAFWHSVLYTLLYTAIVTLPWTGSSTDEARTGFPLRRSMLVRRISRRRQGRPFVATAAGSGDRRRRP